MSDTTTPQLGKLCGDDARRDAVHVAVAPVEAGDCLAAGMRVVLRDGKAVSALFQDGESIGIVDPFLDCQVRPGERFWLFLYPGTVTSLRHVWTHPAFRTALPEVK